MTTIVLRSFEQVHALTGPGVADGLLRVSPVRASTAMTIAAVGAEGKRSGRPAGTGLAILVAELAEAGSNGVEISVSPHGKDRFGAGDSATVRVVMAGSTDEILIEDLEVAGFRTAPVLRAALDERRRVVVTRLGAPAAPPGGTRSPVHALGRAVHRAVGPVPPTGQRLRVDTSASMLARRDITEALCDAVAGLCGEDAPERGVVAPPDVSDGAPWVGSAGELLRRMPFEGVQARAADLLVTDVPPRDMPPGSRALVLVGDDVLELFHADAGRAFAVGPADQQLLLDAQDDNATRAFLLRLSRWLRESPHQENDRETS